MDETQYQHHNGCAHRCLSRWRFSRLIWLYTLLYTLGDRGRTGLPLHQYGGLICLGQLSQYRHGCHIAHLAHSEYPEIARFCRNESGPDGHFSLRQHVGGCPTWPPFPPTNTNADTCDSGIITSILRFVAFYNKSSFTDPTYNSTTLIIWTICEPGVYLIAACLLVYRPLLDKLGIPMIISHTIRGKSGDPSGDFQGGRAVPQSAETAMNGDMDLQTSAGSSFDRTVVSGGFQEFDYGDERPLKNNTGITARTEIEVAWESRAV